MFIGHYRGVSSSTEFYSEQRENLNFPTQVLYKKERYLLNKTIQISSESQRKNIIAAAIKMNIEHDVKID